VASTVSSQLSQLPVAQFTETDVRQIASSEHQRFERWLNIIAYGIPIQSDGAIFLYYYLLHAYGVDIGAPQSKHKDFQIAINPLVADLPVLFSVPSTEFRKHIIQKSFETKGSVSFYGDNPKEDQTEFRALVEELKHRKANREEDLITPKGAIIQNTC